ncbi:extracellular matrix protein 3-like [Amphiura filiformis]|uniref:extracellular matrix protein 3-like n=1 Tax=Amphiura filiformis TaxID=82378 RepID=UPI003B211FB2
MALSQQLLRLFLVVIIPVVVVGQVYFLPDFDATNAIRESNLTACIHVSVTVSRTGSGTGSVRLRVSPSQPGDSDYNEYLSVHTNPATAEDYATDDVRVDFTGSSTSETANICIWNDSEYEPEDETFWVRLELIDGSSGSVRNGENKQVITVLDNDSQCFIDQCSHIGGLGNTEDGLLVNEDVIGGNANIKVKRVGYLPNSHSCDLSTCSTTGNICPGANAVAGVDYTEISTVVLFASGQNEKDTLVPIIDDSIMEPNVEHFDVLLENPVNGETHPTNYRCQISILNDDGEYSLTASSYDVCEPDQTVEVCVERSAENTNNNREVVLSTSISSGDTASAADYTALTSTSGILVFTPGINSQCLNIPITDDSMVEPTETFTVSISEIPTGQIGAIHEATINICDDDVNCYFKKSADSVDENDGILVVEVEREGNLQQGGTVSVSSESGTATSIGNSPDFTGLNNRPVSFPSGNQGTTGTSGIQTQTQTFNVAITNDDVIEEQEEFYLNLAGLSSSVCTVVDPQRMTITIDDDDIGDPGNLQAPGGPYAAGSGLSSSAIGGIVAGTLIGALLLFGIPLCCCCLSGCPCCPWLLAGRTRPAPVVVQQPQIIERRPPPVYQRIQPIQMTQVVPLVRQEQLAISMLEIDVPVGTGYPGGYPM